MGYMGGKFHVRKPIADIINCLHPKVYLEPFCGACWVGQEVRAGMRIFADLRFEMVAMWRGLTEGSFDPPASLTPEMYKAAKDQQAYGKYQMTAEERGFILGCCSFGGKWAGGFMRQKPGVDGDGMAGASRRSVLKAAEKLKGSFFYSTGCYASLANLEGDVVYCDPPYANTTLYPGLPPMDYALFWQAIRVRSQRSIVLISEYTAPEDFTCIAEIPTKLSLKDKEGCSARTERVFMYRYGQTAPSSVFVPPDVRPGVLRVSNQKSDTDISLEAVKQLIKEAAA